jgi:glycosyltransferase involved in cell wall biosynthesis
LNALAGARGEIGPKRILYVVNEGGFFISHRLPLAIAAAKQGYEVHVAIPVTSRDAALTSRDDLRVHHVPLDRAGTRWSTELRTLAALINLYRDVRPDVVHHVTVKPILYGSIAARMTGVPAVVNAVSGLGYLFLAKGTRATMRRRAVKWAYRRALNHSRQKTIFQNRDDADKFVAEGVVSPASVVLIRGSGVDLDQFRPQPEPPGIPIVMLASRLLWDKGVGEFVRAARQLIGEGVAARFVLVGDIDVNRSSVSGDQLNEWCESKVVEWWRYQSDMPATLAQASIVCLPSYREGLPKVLIEAAASGRAIVTTDVPGCRDVVRHNDNGLLVPAGDSEALAGALKSLVDDPDTRHRMGVRGRARAEGEFGIDYVVESTLAVYCELLDGQCRN